MNNVSAYPTYKQSGVQWLGDIPSHWEVKKLKYLCNIITGYTPPKNNDKNYDETGFLWVKPDNLNEFNEIIHTNERVSVQGLRDNFLIPKGSILVCSIGTIGKIGIAGQDLITNQQINSFIFGRHIKNSFAKYMVFSAKRIFDFLANDNVVRILNASTQKHIFFAVPPLAEQTAIANYLDRETAKIDALLQKQAELLAKLSEKRTALITHAVTKGLNPNAPMKNSGVQWLGKVPESWNICRFKFTLAEKLKYGANEPAESDDVYQPRYIRITDIDENGNLKDDTFKSLEFSKARDYLLQKNDILLARSGATVGKSYIYKYNLENLACYAGYLIRARLNQSKYSPYFIHYFLQSSAYWDWIGSTNIQATIQNVSAEKYSDFKMVFPTIDEQTAIAEFLDCETAKIDALCGKIRELSNRLTEYRTTLISDAVTGKIKVIP